MKFNKKRVLILASAFIFAASFNANAQGLGVFPAPDTPTSGSGYYFSLEALFLKPNIQEPLGVLKEISDSTSESSIFNGSEASPELADLENASWDRDGGFRAAIGKNVPNSPWDVGLEFTWITSGDVKDLADNDGSNNGEDLYMSFFPRNRSSNADVINIRGETHLEIFYGDFMARHNMKIGESFTLGISGGLRVAYVENDRLFTATGHDCDNNILGNPNRTILGGCVVSHRSNYWGVGPRVQTQVGWQASDRLNLFANLGFTLLEGEIDRRTDEHSDGGFNDDRSLIQDVRGKTVPVVDSQIGIQYSSGSLSFRLGYEFQNWFGMHDRTLTNTGTENDGAYQQVNLTDIGLGGPFGGMRYTF